MIIISDLDPAYAYRRYSCECEIIRIKRSGIFTHLSLVCVSLSPSHRSLGCAQAAYAVRLPAFVWS